MIAAFDFAKANKVSARVANIYGLSILANVGRVAPMEETFANIRSMLKEKSNG